MARHERFSLPPRSVSVPGGKPRLSMADRQIMALRSEQERAKMRIKSRDELFDDLTNFSYLDPVDEYGLPKCTPYQIPDNVPDVLPLSQEDPNQKTNKDSVSREDSGENPQDGAE